MRNFLYINGSPRGEEKSSSALILKDIAAYIKEEGINDETPEILTLPRSIKKDPDDILETMENADTWFLALPLYVDSLPGHLSWWLKEFENRRKSRNDTKKIRVYGIVNCGFPEAIQNADALRILELFCSRNGLDWRFGVGVGMGEPYKQMYSIPLKAGMKREILAAFQALAVDVENETVAEQENLFVRVRYPRFLYRIQGSLRWIVRSRKNGVKGRGLYARPLLEG